MTVSELIAKLKDCAPNAEVVAWHAGIQDWASLDEVDSDGEEVRLK